MDSSNMPTVEDFQEMFGLTSEEPETSETPEATNPEGETSEEPSVETPPDNNDSAPETPPEEPKAETTVRPDPTQKQNQAFAKMRSENSMMAKTITQMAEILGLDTKQPLNVLASQVQQAQTNALAQKRGVDPQIMQRLESLEADHAELTRMKAEQAASKSIANIKSKFGATDDDITSFISNLINDNYDLTAPGANLETEFISRNFEKIMEKRVADAVAAEQARSAKASGASIPSNKQGQEKHVETHAINSVSELDEFLAENSK